MVNLVLEIMVMSMSLGGGDDESVVGDSGDEELGGGDKNDESVWR